MRKKILLILIPIFFGCSNLKYLDAFDGLNGSPKEIESTTYKIEYNDNLIIEKATSKSINFYDSKGKSIKRLNFEPDGSPSWGSVYYFYDMFGNVIKKKIFNADGSEHSQIKYKYNEYGQEIERIYSWGLTKTIYDRKNRLAEINTKNNNDSLKYFERQKFDKKWNEIELIEFDNIGKQKSRIEFDYDTKGNQIKSSWYNSDDILHVIYISTFNNKNNRTSIKKYRIVSSKPKLIEDTKIEYKYDKKGNLIEDKYILNEKTSWINRYKIKYMW